MAFEQRLSSPRGLIPPACHAQCSCLRPFQWACLQALARQSYRLLVYVDAAATYASRDALYGLSKHQSSSKISTRMSTNASANDARLRMQTKGMEVTNTNPLAILRALAASRYLAGSPVVQQVRWSFPNSLASQPRDPVCKRGADRAKITNLGCRHTAGGSLIARRSGLVSQAHRSTMHRHRS